MRKILLLIIWIKIFVDVQINAQELQQNSVSGEVVNQFTKDLQQLLCEKGNNCVLSGYSIFNAIGLTLAGSSGKTQEQIQSALGLENFKYPQINKLYKDLTTSLDLSISGEVEIYPANRIYGDNKFPFLETYLRTLEKFYDADAINVDFWQDPEGSRVQINEWVENFTNRFIQELLPLDSINSMTIAVLVNAVYFKGVWLTEFNETNTRFGVFTTEPGSQQKVEMMRQSDEKFVVGNLADLNSSFIKLPYEGQNASMYIVVPKPLDNLFAGEGQILSGENILTVSQKINLNDIFNNGEKLAVNLFLPKFTVEFEAKLSDSLKQLGMLDAFDEFEANFGKMVDLEKVQNNIYISEGYHKAKVVVDETGTEAAGATGVVVKPRSAIKDKIDFVVDVPFAFYIVKEPENIVLFSGIVYNPTNIE